MKNKYIRHTAIGRFFMAFCRLLKAEILGRNDETVCHFVACFWPCWALFVGFWPRRLEQNRHVGTGTNRQSLWRSLDSAFARFDTDIQICVKPQIVIGMPHQPCRMTGPSLFFKIFYTGHTQPPLF